MGACKGAPFVAEEIAFQQLLRKGHAVDRHEGPRRTRAPAMDGPRENLLARAALSAQQDRRIAGRRLACGLDDLLERRTLTEERPLQTLQLTMKNPVLLSEGLPFQRLVDHDLQVREVQGLGKEIVRAGLDRLDRLLEGPPRGDDDYRGFDPLLLDRAQHIQAALAGKLEIQKREWKLLAAEESQRFLAVRGTGDVQLHQEQPVGQRVPQIGIVIHEKQTATEFVHDHPSDADAELTVRGVSAKGSVKAKRLPRPISLSAHIRPPWSSTRLLVIANPSPVPCAFPRPFVRTW